MPIRNAIYLDLELLQNVADYYEITYSVETKIVATGTKSSSLKAGVKLPTVADFGGDRGSSNQYQESYEVPARPLRIMNEVIDAVESSGDIRTDFSSVGATFAKGDLARADGALSISPVSEVGAFLSKIFPLMASSAGQLSPTVQSELIASMMSPTVPTTSQLYTLDSVGSQLKIALNVDPNYFFRNSSFEDLEADLTVFGSIESFVGEDGSLPLERWLLPGVDRTMRRAMVSGGIETMLDSLSAQLQFNTTDVQRTQGPAVLIRPMAIY